MIEVEVEDEAWRDLVEVEAIAERAAGAALADHGEKGDRSPPLSIGGGGVTLMRRDGEGVAAAAESDPDAIAAATPPSPGYAWSPPPAAQRYPCPTSGGALTLLLTGDEAVRALNARFRGKDAATNVLSFPAAATAYPHLGDIALAYGVCRREAAAQHKSLADHLSHLVVHGVLHLLGHDHHADVDAEAMEALERTILGRLGVADPYRHDAAHV